MTTRVSIVVAASGQTASTADCLGALLASDPLPNGWQVEILVVGPRPHHLPQPVLDRLALAAKARGWTLTLFKQSRDRRFETLKQEAAAYCGDITIYLESHARAAPPLIAQLATVLDTDEPRYACAIPTRPTTGNRIAAAYGRFTAEMPLHHLDAEIGVFAVNAAGRDRLRFFSDMILKNTFVRLHFRPEEQIRVAATYSLPAANGFSGQVRLSRRRQIGIRQIARRYPSLIGPDTTATMSARQMFSRLIGNPVGAGAYAFVALAVKSPLYRTRARWVQAARPRKRPAVGAFRALLRWSNPM